MHQKICWQALEIDNNNIAYVKVSVVGFDVVP
jgi:hypothetical protein